MLYPVGGAGEKQNIPYLLGNASPGSLHDDVTQLITAFSKA